MKRLLTLGLAAAISCAALVPQTSAQTAPNDVTDPSTDDDIPSRIDDLILPQVQFIFDSVLDPDRVSLVQSVMEGDINNPRLTEAARSIIRNHIIAQQQVELAIRFLQANREEILAGDNRQFNNVFGNIGEARDVAIVDPQPLGTAQIQMGLGQGVTQTPGLFSQFTGIPVTVRFQNQGGGGGGNNNAASKAIASSVLQPGDFIYVGDALSPTLNPDAFVVQIVDIELPATNTQGGGGGGNNMSMITGQVLGSLTATNMNVTDVVFKVLRFDRRPDTARYDRVLLTFEAIRDALAGIDPDLPGFAQLASPITYQREFEDINNIWAPGVATFSALDSQVDRELSRTGIPTMRGADRLVRQAGFSNSDSHLHIDRLADQGNLELADYQGRPTTPLLWTEDNELPLLFDQNTVVPGAADEQRAFFVDQQTIFGEPDNPFTQYIGRAFLEETIRHPGEFFDDTIAVEPGSLPTDFKTGERPERSNMFVTSSQVINNVTVIVFTIEEKSIPEAGDALEEATPDRWQMIIASFAEHSTDLDQFNVAAFGIDQLFGSFVPDDIRAQTASSYGQFADLIGGQGALSIDPRRVEPFGKRGQGGFFPIVPRN